VSGRRLAGDLRRLQRPSEIPISGIGPAVL